jgi:hypothetical protein
MSFSLSASRHRPCWSPLSRVENRSGSEFNRWGRTVILGKSPALVNETLMILARGLTGLISGKLFPFRSRLGRKVERMRNYVKYCELTVFGLKPILFVNADE